MGHREGADQLISWEGGGGRVEEFVKKNCRAPKRHKKKTLHTQRCEKKIFKAKHTCSSSHQ